MDKLLIVFTIVAGLVALAQAEPVELLRFDFAKDVKDTPGLEVVGDAAVEGGTLRSASQAKWQRSGLSVGPVPVSGGALIVEYDVYPVRRGAQCQEFTSQTPSTHWYMIFVGPDGRLRFHTRSKGEWKHRASSEAKCEAGKWYHVTVSLARQSISYRIAERDTGTLVWQAGPIEMDDLGEETVFILTDEAPTEGEGASEWDNLVIKTEDKALAAQWAAKQKELENERRERARREEQIVALRNAGISLIPMPQEVRPGKGKFALSGLLSSPKITAADDTDKDAVSIVQDVISERLGMRLEVGKGGIVLGGPKDSSDALWQKEQSYKLTVTPDEARIEATSPVGFFYAAQTLAQLARDGKTVPVVEVRDWPDIKNRLVMVAVSQGAFKVIDVDYWKRLIRELAAVKMTHIMPYFEGGTFFYEKYPFLGLKGRDGFTVEKGKLLSEYARQRFIELLPQQQCLGHSGVTLGHEQTKHLQEAGGTFCSSKPEVFAFLGDLFDELAQAFPYARHIHIGGDEFAHGFAKCPQCKARADEIGKDGLYAEHIMKLHKMLADRQRGMMIWWHEQGFTESAADKSKRLDAKTRIELAKDIVIFDWHYGNQRDYPSLDRLLKLDFSETWATPAITRYYSGNDDWLDTFGNIQGFMKAALRRKVPGQCTCTWVHGIWGGRNLFELNLYGLLFSAECSWNALASSDADFRRKFAAHWFGLEGENLDQEALQAIHAPFGERKEQKFWRDSRALEPILGEPPKDTAKRLKENPALVDDAKSLLTFCDRADAVLDKWAKQAKRNKATLAFLKHDVHIHQAAARRILCLDAVLRWQEKAKSQPLGAAPKDVIEPLVALVKDYDQIEAMFLRSVKEAGGGDCVDKHSWSNTAKGDIWFRARAGREGVEKLIEALKQGATTEGL